MTSTKYNYAIHPAVGVARLGNSGDEFYLAPDTIGGLPTECDAHGNEIKRDGQPVPVTQFKDQQGRVKRQAARFRILRTRADDPTDLGTEVTLADTDVERIEWVIHIANKKAAWYDFAELRGNLYLNGIYDPENSYKNAKPPVNFRNSTITEEAERRKLIIDPGPRHVAEPGARVAFSRDTIPASYKFGSFPPERISQGYPINTLGEALMDEAGRLVALGAFGNAGGEDPISSYAGANTWHDDVADGPITCHLHLKGGQVIVMDAWLLVGSPKFAPEIVNITTLDDIMFDVGVRYRKLVPELYARGTFNAHYVANFERDIKPIFDRMGQYIWVANTQAMVAFARPAFDPRDTSETNRENREALFSYFRRPSDPQTLFAPNGVPLMPLNAGMNPVKNDLIQKFSTLTETQYFLLGQWAQGKFSLSSEATALRGVHPLDHASVGNCVGEPMSPGIEVTWSLRNPTIYAGNGYRIKHRHDEPYYLTHGLSPSEDETCPAHPEETNPVDGLGCEPGDLTKRMAIPWQADFFQCTVQFINFTDPTINKEDGIPKPPTYYSYWWPPQSPWNVITGGITAKEQAVSGLAAGVQANYARGINSYIDMITGWKYLGFVVNQATGPHADKFPYFVERERNEDKFVAASVAVGSVTNATNATNVTFVPTYFLKDEFLEKDESVTIDAAAASNGSKLKAMAVADERPLRITASPHLGLPRSGRTH